MQPKKYKKKQKRRIRRIRRIRRREKSTKKKKETMPPGRRAINRSVIARRLRLSYRRSMQIFRASSRETISIFHGLDHIISIMPSRSIWSERQANNRPEYRVPKPSSRLQASVSCPCISAESSRQAAATTN